VRRYEPPPLDTHFAIDRVLRDLVE
jgi:hypothetical protein